jgi:hypothetical protein
VIRVSDIEIKVDGEFIIDLNAFKMDAVFKEILILDKSKSIGVDFVLKECAI